MKSAERGGSRYLERSASPLVTGGHKGLRFLNGVENLHHSLIKTAAGLRELQLSRCPVEKSRAQPGFQMANSLADDGRRQIQLTSSRRHAASSDDPGENFEVSNRGHSPSLSQRPKLYTIGARKCATLI